MASLGLGVCTERPAFAIYVAQALSTSYDLSANGESALPYAGSMQSKLGGDRANFPCRDQMLVRDRHGMKRAVEFAFPEIEETP